MLGREKFAVLMAEFIGTFTLTTIVLAMIVRQPLVFFVAATAGGALGLLTMIFGNVSAGHFNPAVTLGLWWIRQIQTFKAIAFMFVQMFGALVAMTTTQYLLGQSIPDRAGAFKMEALVAEALGAAIFTFGITAAISQGYQGIKRATVIGGSLAGGILAASFASNAILNPAVAFAAQSWSWVYATGPLLGALVGVSLYTLVFAPRPAKVAVKAVKTVVAAKATAAKKPAKKPAAKKKPVTRKK